jgi:hypothetical protein
MRPSCLPADYIRLHLLSAPTRLHLYRGRHRPLLAPLQHTALRAGPPVPARYQIRSARVMPVIDHSHVAGEETSWR